MGIRKFVAVVLVVSIVSLVPLQALAQVESRITYGEWCAHLDELHAELHAQQEARVLQVGPFLWGTLALSAGVGFLDWADFEDYLADKYWCHVSQADDYRAVGFLSLAIACVIYVLYWRYLVQRAHEIKTLFGERTIADVQQEIELWEQAGAARMWFYPCE